MRFLTLLLPLALANQSCEPANANVTENTTAPADRARNLALVPAAIQPTTVFDFEDVLWSFRWLPDGHLIATAKDGRLMLINEAGSMTEIDGAPEVTTKGPQAGLLDVLPSQNFAEDRLIYLSYSKALGDDDSNTAVGRGRLSDDNITLENFTDLYVGQTGETKPYHYGSRMVWGPDDKLYFTIGDRGNRDVNPQDTTRDGGKVYRINPDGSIPEDNPFVGAPNAKEAIFSYGHRNPQGLAVHPETGEIWATEHGPRGGDEINVIEAGQNYGWPEITYGINYNGTQITEKVAQEGMVQPIHYWVPSIAPSGTVFVTGDKYPGWENDLLVGSLKFSYLQHVMLDGREVEGEEKLLKNTGRLRDVRMGPDGYIYASVEGTGIVRLDVGE